MQTHPARLSRLLILGALVTLSGGRLSAQPTNDLFDNRTVISGTNLVIYANNLNATREGGEQYIAGSPGGHSVWWEWTAPSGGLATVTTDGSDFDTLLGIYTGTPLVAWMTPITDNDDVVPTIITTSIVKFYPTAGQTYYIAVDGYDASQQGNIQLNLQVAPPQPMAPWTLSDPYGATVDSTNFAGKVVLMNFWATWCTPCMREMPDLVALQDKYRPYGLEIIGADAGEAPSTVTSFLTNNTYGINFQIVMAGPLMGQYIPAGFIPTTYLVNRQNIIVRESTGTQFASILEPELIPLLFDNTVLSSHLNGKQLVLNWPTNPATFTLDSATTLKNPVWTQWPSNSTVVNGSNTIVISPSNTNRFFRLRLVQ